ncbi:MAG TPA: hypothetical protein VGM56_30195 [Byssovorax sp.]|jgi:hypothetical protein
MAIALFCGDALCKASVELTRGREPPWPVRCEKCGTSLYPGDVFERLPANELEPKRGELLTERAGRRVAVASAELWTPAPAKAAPEAELAKLLSMVDIGEPRPTPWGGRSVIVGVAVALIVVAVAVLLVR